LEGAAFTGFEFECEVEELLCCCPEARAIDGGGDTG